MDYHGDWSYHDRNAGVEGATDVVRQEDGTGMEMGNKRTKKIVLCQSVTNNSVKEKEVDGRGEERWKEVDSSTWVDRDIQQYEWGQHKPTYLSQKISSTPPIIHERQREGIIDERIMAKVGENNKLLLASKNLDTSPVITWSEVDAVTVSQDQENASKSMSTIRDGSMRGYSEETVWKVTPKSATNPSKPSSQNQSFHSFELGQSNLNTTPLHSSNVQLSPRTLHHIQSTPAYEDELVERREYRRCVNRNLIPTHLSQKFHG